jgi:hypothetical protein
MVQSFGSLINCVPEYGLVFVRELPLVMCLSAKFSLKQYTSKCMKIQNIFSGISSKNWVKRKGYPATHRKDRLANPKNGIMQLNSEL